MMSRNSISALALFLFTATDVNAAVSKMTQHEFADKITPVLYDIDTTGNDCSSALGISMAMSLLYPTMRDDSKTQVRNLFGYSDEGTSLQWNDTQTYFNTKYKGECVLAPNYHDEDCRRKPWVMIQNSVWTHEKLTLQANYKEVVGDFVQTIDFESQDAGTKVNAWVEKSTQGLIDRLVKDGPLSPWVSLVMNTIYFKGSWKNSFDAAKTTRDSFYAADGTTNEADFMHQVTHLPHWHYEQAGHQVLELPFDGGDLSMYVSLSSNPGDMLHSKDLVKAIKGGDLYFQSNRRVAVALPKFQFFSTYEGETFTNTLRDLGVTGPFDGGLCLYDWGSSSDNCREFIEYMIQKTYIGIDEDGVEAAAVTAVTIGTTSFKPPPTDTPLLFLANRPFQFFIYDKSENVMLFEGLVRDPGIVADSSITPQQVGATSNSILDFWKENFNGVTPEVVMDGENFPSADSGGNKKSHHYSRILAVLTLVGLSMIL